MAFYQFQKEQFIKASIVQIWDFISSPQNLKKITPKKYYIEITDVSGRKATHPFIGAADPHEFSLNAFVPELIPDADTLYFDSKTIISEHNIKASHNSWIWAKCDFL